MEAKHKENKKSVLVYSYIRFSTPEQARGESENRQVTDARAWATRNGYNFDESLTLADRGVSGYHGHNRTKGSLGQFLALVENGEIPAGSILLVENIDRLSREGTKEILQEIIFKLWENGVTLQTLSPEESYPPGSESNPRFFGLLIYIQRANDESVQKSRRLKQRRESERNEARKLGRRLNGKAPAWLRRTEDGFEVIPEAARTIQRIFDLKISGVTSHAIERQLNADAEWVPPKQKPNQKSGGWRIGYVKKILTSPAVFGEYQPHVKKNGKRIKEGEPIEGGYPAVVARETFYAAKATLKQNKGTGGPATLFKNSLRYIVKCAYCGDTMRHDDKGKPPKGGQYLVCSNGERNATCRYPKPYRIRYQECLDVILDNCSKLKPEDVLFEQSEREQRCRSIRNKLAASQAEYAATDRQLDNLTDSLANQESKPARERIGKRMAELEDRKLQLEEVIRDSEAELKIAEQTRQSFNNWKKGLKSLKEAILGNEDEAIETRIKLNRHLREMIESISIFSEGYLINEQPEQSSVSNGNQDPASPTPSNGKRKKVQWKPRPAETWDTFEVETLETMAEHFDVYNDKETVAFIRYVAKLRLTKKGRFLRVKFKSGAVKDLVPEGSLASGQEFCEIKEASKTKMGWRFVRPNLNRLYRDFKTEFRKQQREAEQSEASKNRPKRKREASNG